MAIGSFCMIIYTFFEMFEKPENNQRSGFNRTRFIERHPGAGNRPKINIIPESNQD